MSKKYWCITSHDFVDFYVKAESASKAKYKMYKHLLTLELLEDYSFKQFISTRPRAFDVNETRYNSGKELCWGI